MVLRSEDRGCTETLEVRCKGGGCACILFLTVGPSNKKKVTNPVYILDLPAFVALSGCLSHFCVHFCNMIIMYVV